MDWNLLRSLPLDFVQHFIQTGFVQSNDRLDGKLLTQLSKRKSTELVQRTEYNALRLCNHAMRSCLYKQFKPEQTALAIIYTSRMLSQIDQQDIQLAKLLNLNESRVMECILALCRQLKSERERVLDEMGTTSA